MIQDFLGVFNPKMHREARAWDFVVMPTAWFVSLRRANLNDWVVEPRGQVVDESLRSGGGRTANHANRG